MKNGGNLTITLLIFTFHSFCSPPRPCWLARHSLILSLSGVYDIPSIFCLIYLHGSPNPVYFEYKTSSNACLYVIAKYSHVPESVS